MQAIQNLDQHPTALPMPNGRLATWLFLSTEVMFFAALIGTYLIFRMSAGDRWPSNESVHLSPWIGGCNTLVLIVSSLCLSNAARLATQSAGTAAKVWLMLAIGLGMLFLGIKGYEYREKLALGLLPGAKRSLLHDQPDVYYLAHVKETMNQIPTAGIAGPDVPATDPEPGSSSISGTKQISEWQKATLLGLVQWAELELAKTTDDRLRAQLILSVAETIYPVGTASNLAEAMSAELQQLDRQIENLRGEQGHWEKQLEQFQTQIRSLESTSTAGDGATTARDSGQLAIQKDLAADATERLTLLKQRQVQKLDRRTFLELYLRDPPHLALDEKVGRTLPKVIANGQTWSSNYFLLTGCHALHVAGGLLVMMGLLVLRVTCAWGEWIKNTTLYWHFVDCVWLVLFPLIYWIES